VRRFGLVDRRRRRRGAASEAGMRWSARFEAPGHADTSTPSHQACMQSSHGHSASGARRVILSSIHDHIIYKCHWRLERPRSSPFVACWWSSAVTSHKQRCSNQRAMSRRHTQVTTSHRCCARALHWLPLRQRVSYKIVALVHRCLSGHVPSYMADDLTMPTRHWRRCQTIAFWLLPTLEHKVLLATEHSLRHLVGSETVCRLTYDNLTCSGQFRRTVNTFFGQ